MMIVDQWGQAYRAAEFTRLTAQMPSITRPSYLELSGGTLMTLRARSRFIARNHSHAAGAIKLIIRRTVGAGLRIRARVRDAKRNFLREENQALEAFWNERSRLGLSVRGQTASTFFPLILWHWLVDGDVFLVKTENPARPGVTSEWQVVAGDMIAENINQVALTGVADGNYVQHGVEMTETGKPVAYHMFVDGNSSYFEAGASFRKIERIPAERVLHLYSPERSTAPRGLPLLTPVILRLADLDEYTYAALTQAWAQANTSAFIETPYASERGEMINTRLGAAKGDANYSPQRWHEAMTPGVKEFLLPGEKMSFADPKAPSGTFDPFTQVILRGIAAGIGISYEVLARDYTRTNYSSGRQTENEDKLTFDELNAKIDEQLIDPIWRDHVDHVYFINRLRKAPAGTAAETATLPAGETTTEGGKTTDIYAHEAQHPVKDYANPLQDLSADEVAVSQMFTSRQRVCAKRGVDFFEVVDELAEEQRYMDAVGIQPEALAATIAKASATNPDKVSGGVDPGDGQPVEEPAKNQPKEKQNSGFGSGGRGAVMDLFQATEAC